jgi:hypothetical protein
VSQFIHAQKLEKKAQEEKERLDQMESALKREKMLKSLEERAAKVRASSAHKPEVRK